MSSDFFLQSTDPAAQARKARGFYATAGACLVADVACSAALLRSVHGSFRGFRPAELLDFHGDVADVALQSAARLLLLPVVAFAAAHLGRLRPDSAPPPPPAPRNGASHNAANGNSLTEPLLPVSVDPPAAEVGPSVAAAQSVEALEASHQAALEVGPSAAAAQSVEALEASHRADQRRLVRRNWLLALLFTLCTASAVFVGVKVVSFDAFGDGPKRAERGTLLTLLAALCIAENSALARAVDAATRRPGALRRELHPHALFYASDKTIVAHLCDCCRKRITAGYRCQVCDFDCCVQCFVRRDLRSAEGGLRTDRGVEAASETPPSAYFLRALAMARSEGPLLAAAMACLAFTTAATLTLPHYQGRILDTVWRGDAPAFRRDVTMLVLYSIASGAFGGLRALCFNLVGRRLAFDVRNSLLRALLTQDIAFFDAAATGDLTSRLSYDVNNMLSPIQSLLSSVVENGALLVGSIVACFLQSWQLSLLACTTLTPATYVIQLYAAWSSTLNRHIAAALGEGNAAATEALANIRTVRVMSTEDEECAKYEERTKRALACGIRDACGGALALALTNYLNLFTSVLILGFGGSMALQNHAAGRLDGLTAGKLVTFQLFWGMFGGAFRSLQSLLASFTRSAGSAQRVLGLLDTKPAIAKSGGYVPPVPPAGSLTLRDVTFVYQMRPTQTVLSGVALEVRAGSICALVGKSGGGKSTLCHLLLRLYDPTSGSISLDGRDLRELDLRWLHRHTGCVAQDTQLFANSVLENITYGCPTPPTPEQLRAATVAAHAHDFIAAFPDGYDTRVGERGVRLSGGQKQRIAIARALLRDPRLLVLDEATSALDAESEALVQAALDTLLAAGGRTVVLVAHRLSTVAGADQIAVLDGGTVAERGTHAELVTRQGGLYARLVARQMAAQANLIEPAASRDADKVDDLLAAA